MPKWSYRSPIPGTEASRCLFLTMDDFARKYDFYSDNSCRTAIPDSNSQFIARNLANMGVSPETAGQFGAGVSMATTDPGGFFGLLQMMVTSQIESSKVMADAAKKMAESVERSSINSKANGARGMAGAASQ